MSNISRQTDNRYTGGGLTPSSCRSGDVSIDTGTILENLSDIKNKIVPYTPRIIAVTKYYGLDTVINGYKAGLREFGESRAAEAVKKIEALPAEIQNNSVFHFIGHLQKNKAEKVVKYFDYIHSVDSLKIARAISKAACRLNKREKILLQVNNAGEEQKFGYTKKQLVQDFSEILNLEMTEVCGLMNMAPLGAGEEELHRLFGDLRTFKDDLEREFKVTLPELSMGMSNDYEAAVKEGATMIRVGRKLFN